MQIAGIPDHVWRCRSLGVRRLFLKPDQADWLYLLDSMQRSECADTTTHTQRRSNSWLMSGLSLQIISVVSCRKLNDRPARCLCVCVLLSVSAVWNCVIRPSLAAINAAAWLTVIPRLWDNQSQTNTRGLFLDVDQCGVVKWDGEGVDWQVKTLLKQVKSSPYV